MNPAPGVTVSHLPALVSVRDRWGWVLALGATLLLCGLIAILLPTFTATAVSTALGVALVAIGVVKIIEAIKVKDWGGFPWRIIPGVIEVAGGIMIYASYLKWAIAIALVAAVVLAVQAVAQINLAYKARPHPGWAWLFAAGIVALCASIVLFMKFPMIRDYPPSTIAGISLFIAGFAYVVIAFAVRRSGRPV
jgi:uncharacterized membrane protein HdeD (DUF308 family)